VLAVGECSRSLVLAILNDENGQIDKREMSTAPKMACQAKRMGIAEILVRRGAPIEEALVDSAAPAPRRLSKGLANWAQPREERLDWTAALQILRAGCAALLLKGLGETELHLAAIAGDEEAIYRIAERKRIPINKEGGNGLSRVNLVVFPGLA
jgi:hypothetical protein